MPLFSKDKTIDNKFFDELCQCVYSKDVNSAISKFIRNFINELKNKGEAIKV